MHALLTKVATNRDSVIRDLLITLQQLLSGPLRVTLSEPFSIFMLARQGTELLVDHEMAFLAEADSLSYLTGLQSNSLSAAQIRACLDEQQTRDRLLDEQAVFIFKSSKKVLAEHLHTSRVSLSLAQLRANATVIMLDKDKELMKEQRMIEQLEQVAD